MRGISAGLEREDTQDRIVNPNRDLQAEKTGCVCFETFPFIPLAFIDLSSKKSFSRRQQDRLTLLHPVFFVTVKPLSNSTLKNVINRGWEDEDYLPSPSFLLPPPCITTPEWRVTPVALQTSLQERNSLQEAVGPLFAWEPSSSGLGVWFSRLSEEVSSGNALKEAICTPDPDKPHAFSINSSHGSRWDEQGGSYLSPYPEPVWADMEPHPWVEAEITFYEHSFLWCRL